jgi:hypothetical protein
MHICGSRGNEIRRGELPSVAGQGASVWGGGGGSVVVVEWTTVSGALPFPRAPRMPKPNMRTRPTDTPVAKAWRRRLER